MSYLTCSCCVFETQCGFYTYDISPLGQATFQVLSSQDVARGYHVGRSRSRRRAHGWRLGKLALWVLILTHYQGDAAEWLRGWTLELYLAAFEFQSHCMPAWASYLASVASVSSWAKLRQNHDLPHGVFVRKK